MRELNIQLIFQEDDLCQFDIQFGVHLFKIQGFLYQLNDLLLLTGVDVEGPGQNQLGKRIHRLIDNACKAFCRLYQTERILILGGKRTMGRTKGMFFRPIYRKLD